MSNSNDFYRLWQHDNGSWYIIWSPENEAKANSRGTKRISTGTSDRRAAEQYRAQFIAGLKNEPPKDEPTIAELLRRYRNEHGINTRSLKTIDYHVRKLEPFFGDLLPSHVSNNLLKEYVTHRGVKDGTILREIGTLKAALHYAEGNRWIERQTDHIIEYNGKPTHSVKKSFSRLCKDCGIKASAHALRHTAATWMVIDGVPLSEVARVLGDSEKTVETVYGKHSPDYLRRAVNALNFKPKIETLQP